MSFSKLVRDGKVAVLISGGFGAGWSTWNSDHPGLLFDQDLVLALEENRKDLVVKLAEERYPECYTGGIDGLYIRWLNEGTKFLVEEYDGSEGLRICDDTIWNVA